MILDQKIARIGIFNGIGKKMVKPATNLPFT